MKPDDLVDFSERLIRRMRRGAPKQVDLKKAISALHGAVFHAICENTANCLIGVSRRHSNIFAWELAYRAVDHGFSRSRYLNSKVMAKFCKEIRFAAESYIELQRLRQKADYNLLAGSC